MEYDTAKNNIQGWMNDTDLLWLFDTAKEMESIVEIGSWKGRSTHALLSGCKGIVYAVDHFLGSIDEPAEADAGDVYKDFMKNVGGFKNLKVLKMDSSEAVKQFPDNSIDMVFIDAGHAYEEFTFEEIKRWLPKAKKIICGHNRRQWTVKKGVRMAFGYEGWEANEGKGNMWIKKIQTSRHSELDSESTANDGRGSVPLRQLAERDDNKLGMTNGLATSKPDLSILIPAKNEEFLKRTVEDILENIEGNTEVIVVLDGYETALPKMPEDKRVRVITNPVGLGQRGATNQACKLSKAKYVMKVDAHCAFDKGFDVKMMREMEGHDNWTMVPVMRNLHAFNWVCTDGHSRYQGPSGPCMESGCGKPTVKDVVWIAKTNPQSVSYCFDEEPHFQYFNEYRKRPEAMQGNITETMSIQGSCFMLAREKYWDLNISDETLGSWGSQGIEVACKTWLSGGRVVVNHKTWYAHMFRTQGGDFGFPYENPGRKVQHAKQTVKELFFDNKWEKQIYPLSWLLEKFWPVPGWSEDARTKLKAWPLQNGKEIPSVIPAREPELSVCHSELDSESTAAVVGNNVDSRLRGNDGSVGIIYYTDNLLDEKIMKACQKQLIKASGGKKIVSVSLKPMDFGQNVVLPLERGRLTMFKQILVALLTLDTDIVFFCEHDVLYHPSHFDFMPTDRNVWYYNGNYWFLRYTDGHALHYDASPLSGSCVYRDIAIKHYQERIALVEKEGYSHRIGYEPMTHGRIKWENAYVCKIFQSAAPNIDIKHGKNLTEARWRIEKFVKKPTDWKEADIDTIPGWDNVRKLLR
jgi:glycosyltransferase involved in cell wall biosynthesis